MSVDSTIGDDIQRAIETIRKMKPNPLQFDTVENHDGLAVFKRLGNVVGWMPYEDFEQLMKDLEARK